MAALTVTTLLWAVSFPLIRALSLAQQARSPGVSTWFVSSTIVALRFLLGAAVLSVVSPRSLRGVTRSEWVQGVGLGVLCGVGIPWQADGLSHTDASVSAFISQGYCVWIPAYVCLAGRRRPSPDLLVSSALVLAGIFALSGADLAGLRAGRGEVETLVASLFCAAQMLWLERPRFRDNRSVTVTAVMFLVTGLIAAPVAVATGGPASWAQLLRVPHFVETMTVLTVLCTAAPFVLMNHFQRRVAVTEAGLIYCAEPIFAGALSLFVPGLLRAWMGAPYANETVTPRLLLGGALITAANLWMQARKAPPVTPCAARSPVRPRDAVVTKPAEPMLAKLEDFFTRSPLAIAAAVAPAATPVAVRAVGCRVVPTTDELEVIFPTHARFEEAAAVGALVAVTCAELPSHASFQFKGAIVALRPASEEEAAFGRGYARRLYEHAAGLGFDLPAFEASGRLPLSCLRVAVREVFDQRPQVGAGAPVGGA